MRDLTEDEVLQAIQAANLGGNTAVRLTYDSGPYEVTRPTPIAEALARAVARKFCEVNGIADGAKATHAYDANRHPNGYWCPNCVGPASADGVTGNALQGVGPKGTDDDQ